MPFEINMELPPGGYALTSARPGENLPVVDREFTSSEDGQHFIQRLEGFPSDFINLSPTPTKPSQVDSLLAIIHPDGNGIVYLNEVPLLVIARSTGPVTAGSAVYKDDIADIEKVQLDVNIPADAGFMYLFSVGWRKGLFYDFGPLGPRNEPRQFDVSVWLGSAVAHVFFQERFAITPEEWRGLFEQQWFPFVGLRNQTIADLLNHVRSGWDCEDMLDLVIKDVTGRAGNMLESWRNHHILVKHIELLEHAVNRFLDDDPMSCAGLLFSRIEGILRTYREKVENPEGTNPSALTNLAVRTTIQNYGSLLLPQRFKCYLDEVYFANFDVEAKTIPFSRHSVGHGVANASDFNRKSAVIGILIVHQLFYFM